MRRSFVPSALAAVLAVAACTRVGGPGAASAPEPTVPPGAAASAPPDVSGPWSGYLSVEGQGLEGTLQVDQSGSTLDVTFDAPTFGLRAAGEGEIDSRGRVRVTLAYDLQCPGSADLEGRLSDDGMALDGSLSAEDCTGSSGGSFSFRR